MAEHDFTADRRTVLRGGALGAGALLGAVGLSNGQAAAAAPTPMIAATPSDSGPAGVQVFLKIDGIPGESQHKGLERYIELSDFSWGSTHTTKNGVGKGKPVADEVRFRAPVSSASPLLMLRTVTGETVSSAYLVVTRGGEQSPASQFIKTEFTDVAFSSYDVEASNEGKPYDTATLSFGRIKFSYYPADDKGGVADPVTMEWDTRSQKD